MKAKKIQLVVAEQVIPTNRDGLFCLNDLHRAAVAPDHKKPSEWMRLETAQELIAEIEKAGIPAIKSRQRIGTFACKELVYAYAMWLSAAFHLKVIRAFDALVSGQIEEAQRIALRQDVSFGVRHMNRTLHDRRIEDGKETKGYHYINEALLLNEIVTGKREPLQRESLNPSELELLAELEYHNAKLIDRGLHYEVRKIRLMQLAREFNARLIESCASTRAHCLAREANL